MHMQINDFTVLGTNISCIYSDKMIAKLDRCTCIFMVTDCICNLNVCCKFYSTSTFIKSVYYNDYYYLVFSIAVSLMFAFPGGQVVDILNERDGPLPVDVVLKIFYQACKAVQHMHKQSPPIIHRDLKV